MGSSWHRGLWEKKGLIIFISFLLLFALVTHKYPLGWNDSARLATIESLVDEGTFVIDNSGFLNQTGDKYFYRGHFYSDKPASLQIYSAPIYYAMRSAGIGFWTHPRLSHYLIVFLTIGIISALGLVYLQKSLQTMGVDGRWSALLTLIAGTGTLILPYSGVYNNHVVSGALLMMAFYHLLRIGEGARYAILAGFLLSLAGSTDITTFIFIPFALIVFHKRPHSLKLAFLLSTVPVILIYLLINLHISGSPLPPALNTELWDFPGSSFGKDDLSGHARHDDLQDLGIYAFHMILGRRGLFSHTPILLFSLYALLKIFRGKSRYIGYYLYITLASTAFILSFIFMSTNYSGGAFGVRWFATLMLLGILPISEMTKTIERSKEMRTTFILLAAASILISMVGTINPYGSVADASKGLIVHVHILMDKSYLFYLKMSAIALVTYAIFCSLCKDIFKAT